MLKDHQLRPVDDLTGDRAPAALDAPHVPEAIPQEVPLVAFSHLRWDFVRQRPQHLLSRFASERAVWFWEEPIPCDHHLPYLEYHHFAEDKITALRPRVPHSWTEPARAHALAELYRLFQQQTLQRTPIAWFYTAAMLPVLANGGAELTVYDCMDELSAFAHADAELIAQEAALLARADIVFTGGKSLYEAKRNRNPNVHAFPSAVDRAHFAAARTITARDPAQRTAGYFGVIDERLDLELIAAMADALPEWRIEMVGPVVKIDPASLPQRPNISWIGPRRYADLPGMLARWNVALMPFALNEATRFISPTKTPEYLAGGRPVVSTPIADVIADWGSAEGVAIAADAEEFAQAVRRFGALPAQGAWLTDIDQRLNRISWDQTQGKMSTLMAQCYRNRHAQGGAGGAAPAILRGSKPYDTLIVGAGFAGSVMAERLARDAGQQVLVVDRRPHVGGNAYDETDAAGVLIHRYGPHIFHTNSREVFDYLSQFTSWRPYEHRVLAKVGDQLVPMPINRTTLEKLYGVALTDDAAAEQFLAARAEPREPIVTSEDVVVSVVGQELYEKFFRGYTRKQWGLDPSQLDRTVTSRVPTRTDRDDRYFQDSFQAMPADGYTAMFKRMLDHPSIELRLGTEFAALDPSTLADHTVFTGPIDEYFNYRFGKLPYRSLRFHHETHDTPSYQPVAVVNYPDEATPYTRITEYKKLTGQDHPQSSISYEYPTAEGDPYYPIPRPENQDLFKRYEQLARELREVTFVGRLANYRYYNMDQVVGQALATYRRMGLSPAEAGMRQARVAE